MIDGNRVIDIPAAAMCVLPMDMSDGTQEVSSQIPVTKDLIGGIIPKGTTDPKWHGFNLDLE